MKRWMILGALTLLALLLLIAPASSGSAAAPPATPIGGGAKIAFIRSEKPQGFYKENIFMIDVNSKRQYKLTENRSGAYYDSPSWSPDGKFLAFGIWINPLVGNGNYGHSNIYVQEIGTANV